MARTKKTIIQKKPTVTVEEYKPRRGRPRKNQTVNDNNEVIKATETRAKATKTKQPKKKTTTAIKSNNNNNVNDVNDFIKIIEQQKAQINELQNKSNNSFETLKTQVNESQKEIKDSLNMLIKSEQQNETLQERVRISKVKYRTKYMELEHCRRTWNSTKTELLNIISDLKAELIKYAPDDAIFEIAQKITEITQNNNHVASSKALKMPED